MRQLLWSKSFTRVLRRALRRIPNIRARIERTLQQMSADVFQSSLSSHKFKGELEGVWSCSVDYDYRILFEIVKNPDTGEEEILLLTLGTHDEVY